MDNGPTNNQPVNNEQLRPADEPCPECAFGNLKPKTATFARWMAGQFITVPDFPVWACDACGYTEDDHRALEQIEALVGPAAELERSKRRAARRAQSGEPGKPRPGQPRLI